MATRRNAWSIGLLLVCILSGVAVLFLLFPWQAALVLLFLLAILLGPALGALWQKPSSAFSPFSPSLPSLPPPAPLKTDTPFPPYETGYASPADQSSSFSGEEQPLVQYPPHPSPVVSPVSPSSSPPYESSYEHKLRQ